MVLAKQALRTFLLFCAGLPIVALIYQITDWDLVTSDIDIHSRFGVPLKDHFGFAELAYIYADYTIFTFTFWVMGVAWGKTPEHERKMVISGVLSSIVITLIHRYWVTFSFTTTPYVLPFAIVIAAWLYVFATRKRRPVNHRLIATVAAAHFVFVFTIHIVGVLGTVYTIKDRFLELDNIATKGLAQATLALSADELKNLYGDSIEVSSFSWSTDSDIPKELAANRPLVEMVSRSNKDGEGKVFWSNKREHFLDKEYFGVKLSLSNGIHSVTEFKYSPKNLSFLFYEFYILIYSLFTAFTTIWLIGLCFVVNIHKKL